MGATITHPAMPMLRQAERTLANALSGGLDQLSDGNEEISGLILQLREAGLEHIAAALQRALSAQDSLQRTDSLLRAFTVLGIVRTRLAEGMQADLSNAPLLSERSRLHIPPLPAGSDLGTLTGTLALLASHDPLHRMYAAERVTQWGDEAIPRLMALIQRPKQEAGIKRLAARCISQIETPAALEGLVRLTSTLVVWREVYAGLLQRGPVAIEPLQTMLSNPPAGGAWLIAKVLWQLNAKEALRAAYKAARTPKPPTSKAFEAYHQALSLTHEQVRDIVERYRSTDEPSIILLLAGVERGWVSEDEFITLLDSQERYRLRISLRYVYGTALHGPVLAYYQRMLRTATKYVDTDRARIGIITLSESSLYALNELEEEDEA